MSNPIEAVLAKTTVVTQISLAGATFGYRAQRGQHSAIGSDVEDALANLRLRETVLGPPVDDPPDDDGQGDVDPGDCSDSSR